MGNLDPMLCKHPQNIDSADKYISNDNIIFERKYDGVRIIALISNNNVNLINRHGVNVTKKYPVIIEQLKTIDGTIVLDGEIIYISGTNDIYCHDALYQFHGIVEDFNILAKRSQLSSESKIRLRSKTIKLQFMVFDILYSGKTPLSKNSWIDRQKYLDMISFDTFQSIFRVQSYKTAEQKLFLTQTVISYDYEGILGKDALSTYVNGISDAWMKFKNVKDGNFVFNSYELNNAGVKLIKTKAYAEDELELDMFEKSITVQCSGRQSVFVLDSIIKHGKITVKVNYLSYTTSKRLRQPTFNRIM